MLTDIFANRYATVALWETFTEQERRLLVQSYRILAEDVCPYYRSGNEYPYGKEFWTDIQSRLSRELGLKSLSDTVCAIQRSGAAYPMVVTWSMDHVCETWMRNTVPHAASVSASSALLRTSLASPTCDAI